MKNAGFSVRLGFAARGVRTVFRREKSFRTQTYLAAAAAMATAALRRGMVWAALVLVSTGLVLALEMVNAALEYALDRLHSDLHPEIGLAKDAAAGAVLVASATALGIGLAMIACVFL
jgi:diacylglycerol kinase (ATP)